MEKISALEIKDGLFDAGKIHTSYVNNFTTLALYIQTPELWEFYSQNNAEEAAVIKEQLVSLVRHWQQLLKEQKLTEEIIINPENL